MPNVRSRNFCFTFNNPIPGVTEEYIKCLRFRYLLYGRETCPTTGTPHLQGLIVYEHAKTFEAARKELIGAHISVTISIPAAVTYCKKDGDFVEIGEPPKSKEEIGKDEKKRWRDALEAAKKGDIDSIPADIVVRYYSTLKRIGTDYVGHVEALPGVCGIWIYGSSGAGKTHAVYQNHPDCYSKPRNVWWDGYQGEDVVLLDDIDKFDVKLAGKLKHWADKYPFMAEVKGGSLKIRPKKFIVTSQYHIDDIWTDRETLEALHRRFKLVEKIREQNIII